MSGLLFPDSHAPRSRSRARGGNRKRVGSKFIGKSFGVLFVLNLEKRANRVDGSLSFSTYSCRCSKCGGIDCYSSNWIIRNPDFCKKCAKPTAAKRRRSKENDSGSRHEVGEVLTRKSGFSFQIIEGPLPGSSGCVYRCKCLGCKKIFGKVKPIYEFNGCRHCANERAKKPLGVVSQVYGNFCYSAKTQKIKNELSLEQWLRLVIQPCVYCGTRFSNTRKINGRVFKSNGVDKVKPSKEIGYTVENSVPCCWPCNLMKNSMSVDTFISQCRMVARKTADREIATVVIKGSPNRRGFAYGS